MDANAIIDDIQKRLTALADDPPYRFLNTTRRNIEAHLSRLKTFIGYTEEEVAGAERRLGIALPTVYRTFLLRMGKAYGDLFRGSYVAGIEDFEDYRDEASELMAENEVEIFLPPDSLVFMNHQGCAFLYLSASATFDSPVYVYTEGEKGPSQATAGFAELLDGELRMAEENRRNSQEQGGYYLTVNDDGSASMFYPAAGSGDRPLDKPISH